MNLRAAGTIAVKDLRLLVRDLAGLFWVLVFPVLFAVFFGAVLEAGVAGKSARWPVVLIDEADTETSRQLLTELTRAEALATRRASLELARRAVASGQALAFVRITPEENVEIGADASQRVQGQVLARLVEGIRAQAMIAAAPVPVDVGPAALRFISGDERKPSSSYQLVFPAALLWGLMGCAASFAVALITESTSGTMVRLHAAPFAHSTVMAGKALACFLACSADGFLLWLFGAVVFGIQVGSPLLLVLALQSTVVCFVGITMTLASLGRTEQAVASAGWSTLIVFAMLGGAMVPRAFMPEWLQRASLASPVYWAIRALEGATWRGATLAELVAPCAILLAIGVVGFGVGVRAMARRV